MPNAITLTSEYCPSARRSTLVTLMFCGFTVDGWYRLGTIAERGRQHGILAIGGVLPLLTLPFLIWLLPESLRFMVLQNKPEHRIQQRRSAYASRADKSADVGGIDQ